jgi:hemoglobin
MGAFCSSSSDEPGKKVLFKRLGGDAAVEAAVELFYKKILADDRIKHFFEDTNMMLQHRRQVNFLAFAFGKPGMKYEGLNMDRAHRKLVRDLGMDDSHFDAVAGNLQDTLKELGIADDVTADVMTAVGGLREQVMCRGKWAEDQE